MKNYAVVVRNDERSKQMAKQLRALLTEEHYDETHPDTVFVIGGDGTFLSAVHQYLDQLDTVCFLGICTGTLGFFTEYTAEELTQCVEEYHHSTPHLVSYALLEAKTPNQCFYAVNEVRVENVYRTQLLDISINDKLFEVFRGTGVCVSTQCGSTAYNRSLGGAILDEGLELLQLAEITGIHHSAYHSLRSPYVLRGDSRITLQGHDFTGAVMCYDHLTFDLSKETVLSIARSEKRVRILRYQNRSYQKRLHSLF